MTLKDWLAERGIKQSWLADRVGAQASAMSLYVNHLRLPKLPLRILIEQETRGAVNRHSDWPNGKERQ